MRPESAPRRGTGAFLSKLSELFESCGQVEGFRANISLGGQEVGAEARKKSIKGSRCEPSARASASACIGSPHTSGWIIVHRLQIGSQTGEGATRLLFVTVQLGSLRQRRLLVFSSPSAGRRLSSRARKTIECRRSSTHSTRHPKKASKRESSQLIDLVRRHPS